MSCVEFARTCDDSCTNRDRCVVVKGLLWIDCTKGYHVWGWQPTYSYDWQNNLILLFHLELAYRHMPFHGTHFESSKWNGEDAVGWNIDPHVCAFQLGGVWVNSYHLSRGLSCDEHEQPMLLWATVCDIVSVHCGLQKPLHGPLVGLQNKKFLNFNKSGTLRNWLDRCLKQSITILREKIWTIIWLLVVSFAG